MSKMHVYILGLAIPMHTSTVPQDFPKFIFQQGAVPPQAAPLKTPMIH